MALIGIILQALAGVVYGVSYLIGVERMDKWKESTKAWLANTRNRVKVSYLLTFLTPLAFVIYIYKLQENNIQWYTLIPGFIVSWGLIALTYTSFLLIWSKSKSIANILNNPSVNQMMRNSNIASIILGIILMILGGVGIKTQAGLVTGTNISSVIVPIILLTLALTALCIGFVLVLMPVVYYLCMLFVTGVSMLFRPRKALWILVLSLYLAGCALLITNEIYKPG